MSREHGVIWNVKIAELTNEMQTLKNELKYYKELQNIKKTQTEETQQQQQQPQEQEQEPQPQPQQERNTKKEKETEREKERETEREKEGETEGETETETNTEINTGTETNTEINTEKNTGTETNTEKNTEKNTETNTETYLLTNTDINDSKQNYSALIGGFLNINEEMKKLEIEQNEKDSLSESINKLFIKKPKNSPNLDKNTIKNIENEKLLKNMFSPTSHTPQAKKGGDIEGVYIILNDIKKELEEIKKRI